MSEEINEAVGTVGVSVLSQDELFTKHVDVINKAFLHIGLSDEERRFLKESPRNSLTDHQAIVHMYFHLLRLQDEHGEPDGWGHLLSIQNFETLKNPEPYWEFLASESEDAELTPITELTF